MNTPNLADAERLLKQCQIEETAAIEEAAAAIRRAVECKLRRLHAWINVAQASGSTDPFKKTYQETVELQYRADRGCAEYVHKALKTGMLSRLGIDWP
jgi:hydroxymethylpyrimidine/phosphomethylpyrimidine kinase